MAVSMDTSATTTDWIEFLYEDSHAGGSASAEGSLDGALTGPVATSTSQEATVSTDKLDYAPGETTVISGSGFTPYTQVVIQIVDDPNRPGDDGDVDIYAPIIVTTDASGAFTANWLVPTGDDGSETGTPDALNGTLLLTATSSDGLVATATFTDAGPNYGPFNSLLPATATETLSSDIRGPFLGNPSYFNVEITNGGILDGLYDGWCIRSDRNIGLSTYNVDVYSTYGFIPPGVIIEGGQPADVPADQVPFFNSLQQVNWIFNNITTLPLSADGERYDDSANGREYTIGDIQNALWVLTGTPQVPSSILGPFTQDNVDFLIDEARDNGSDFLAKAGDYIGILLDPEGNRQDSLISLETAGIGDTVFFDSNSNGVADDGEGIAGVTVKLLADVDGDDIFEVVATTVTGDNPDTPEIEAGYYFFGPLLAGPDGGPGVEYRVMVDTTTLPEGYINTVDPDGAPDFPPGDSMSSEVLTPGEINLLQDFGYQAFDFGDAPDIYGTTLASNGARHLLTAGQTPATPVLKLGALIDTELSGFPSVGADGDNLNNLNDEDGIVIDPITAGQSFMVFASVMESADVDGRLNAWIDFNGNGNFDDPFEYIIINKAVVNGDNMFTVNAPVNAVAGPTYARFRLSSDPAAQNPTGLASDGEVEDYLVNILGPVLGSIGDEIFFDRNSNGVRDAGEGFAGVTVGLDTTGDGVADIFDVTDADGFYLFEGLVAGDYKVIVDTTTIPTGGQPITYSNTVDPDGGNDSMSMLTLAPGEDNLVQDFGYQAFDYGDAPDSYGTTNATNGARHLISVGQTPGSPLLKLGFAVDSEPNGQPNGAATGDDTNLLFGGPVPPNVDDEDGIVIDPIIPGQAFMVFASVMESADVDGRLNAWIDFNGNGNFDDPFEYIIIDKAVVNGGNMFTVNAPVNAVAGPTYARFRLSSDPAAQSSTGLASDGEVEDYLVTIQPLPPASLGDFVFDDLNANGEQNAGEPGVSDVTVNLYKDTNGDGFGDLFVETTQTNAQGFYLFDDLAPNMDYQVEFILPADFVSFTLPNAIPPANDATDSDANPLTGRAPVVSLAPGEFNSTIDAGLLKPAAIGDFVFKDLNGNGIQDPGEPGVEDVTVTLTGTDVFGNPVDRMTTTGPNGEYLFNGDTLLPGTYKVTFSDLAPNHAFTVPDQGGNDATDSDADPTNGMTPFVTVGSGESNLTLDAGLVGTGIEIIKFVNGDDANDPTGPILTVGDVVTFTYEVRNTGNVSLANVVVLDDNGTPGNPADDFNPIFTGGDLNGNSWLDLGEVWTYEASSTVLEGQYTNIATTTGTPIYPPGTNNPNFPPGTPVPNLPPPTDDDPGNYFGEPAPVGSIGDEIFFDRNSNGVRDAGEGFAGVTVGLDTTGDGVADIFDVTDADGFYLFDGLVAGDYKVIVDTTTIPTGGQPITYSNTVDPDGGNNSMSMLTLAPGEDNLVQDFGYQAFDYGDAPDSYGTTNATNGARHLISVGQTPGSPLLKLGFAVDSEPNGQPNGAATGDDTNLLFGGPVPPNVDDEDGIFIDPIIPGQAFMVFASVMESADVDGRLNAWIDFNGNGNFDDPFEYIIIDKAVVNGGNMFTVNAPVNAVAGPTYARFRLSSDPAAQSSTGLASDGEVEDYLVTIQPLPPASLGDFVFDDLNANGEQNAGEPGVSDVTVNLYKDTNGDGFGDLFVETTQTNAQGFYLFDDLAPNMDYQVEFILPADFVSFTLPNAIPPANDATDSDANPLTGRAPVVSLAPASQVEFILPADFVSFTLPNAIPPANDATDSDANPLTGRAPVVSLAPGEFNSTIDAGLLKPAAIGDFVFKDLNGNGIQDPGEPGVEDVTVTLTGTDVFGNPVDQMTTTGPDGEYLFNGDTLLPGTYKVTFSDLAPNHAFTVPDQGGNDATDSDADPNNGMTPFVTVGSGESNLTLDAGLVGTGIEIIKFVNGDDANAPTGPILTVGDVVTFTYEVRNTGNVSLANVVVLDDNGTPGNPADDFNPVFTGGDTNNNTWLDLGEIWTYEASSTVLEGQYTNIATTTGTPIYPPGTNNPNFPPGTPVPGLDAAHRRRSGQLLRSGARQPGQLRLGRPQRQRRPG